MVGIGLTLIPEGTACSVADDGGDHAVVDVGVHGGVDGGVLGAAWSAWLVAFFVLFPGGELLLVFGFLFFEAGVGGFGIPGGDGFCFPFDEAFGFGEGFEGFFADEGFDGLAAP